MPIDFLPDWMANLDHDETHFIKKFILASGSLKEMAKEYQVTYPTVRLRLDKLIHKVKVNEDLSKEPYISLIRKLALDEKIDVEAARILIEEYKKLGEE